MSCACRTAPWRTFVQGLVQVHRAGSDTPANVLFRGRQTQISRATTSTRTTTNTFRAYIGQQARGLHGSAYLMSSHSASAAVEFEQTEDGSSRPTNLVLERSEANLPTQDSSKQTPKTPKTPRKPKSRSPRSASRERKLSESAEEGVSSTVPKVKKPRWRNRTDLTEDGLPPGAQPRVKKPRWRNRAQPTDESQPVDSPTQDGQPENLQFNKDGPPEDSPVADGPPEDGFPPSTPQPKMEEWRIQKIALKEKFPEGWKPRKRLSPDALAGIRALNAQFPDIYTTSTLANKFEVSSEAIRRILKSRWQPSVEEEVDRQDRWTRRGMSVWERKAALGIKPPRKWREAGVTRDPSFHEWSERAKEQSRAVEEEEIQQYREQIQERQERQGVPRGLQQEEGESPGLSESASAWAALDSQARSGTKFKFTTQKERRLQRKRQKEEDKALAEGTFKWP